LIGIKIGDLERPLTA